MASEYKVVDHLSARGIDNRTQVAITQQLYITIFYQWAQIIISIGVRWKASQYFCVFLSQRQLLRDAERWLGRISQKVSAQRRCSKKVVDVRTLTARGFLSCCKTFRDIKFKIKTDISQPNGQCAHFLWFSANGRDMAILWYLVSDS